MLFYLEFLGLRSKSNIKFYLATGNDLYMRPNIFTAVSGAASNSISQSPLNCAEVFYKLATSRRIDTFSTFIQLLSLAVYVNNLQHN